MAGKYHYVILGAGRQGVALAYDLARFGEAARLTLADLSSDAAGAAVSRLAALLPDQADAFVSAEVDVAASNKVRDLLRGADVALSAAPYRFNEALTRDAVAAGVSFCDLGGNTQVVERQLAQHDDARAAGVSIVPDCGLAPGLGNLLAADGVGRMDEPQDVHIRCGGLPEKPTGPLGYKLVFNFDGLINEYSGCGDFLRAGERVQIPTLSEIEPIDLARPGAGGWVAQRYEAAVTSGGTSTCPATFAGRLRTYDYKTVRYPGHFAIVKALFEIGAFEDEILNAAGEKLSPRLTMRALFEERMTYPEVRDVVFLRADVKGRNRGAPAFLRYDLFDRHDEATGFTAMERTTAYPTAVIAHMQARRLIEPGARPLEICVPTGQFLQELSTRGLEIRISENPSA